MINWRRGLFRFWIVSAIFWIIGSGIHLVGEYREDSAELDRIRRGLQAEERRPHHPRETQNQDMLGRQAVEFRYRSLYSDAEKENRVKFDRIFILGIFPPILILLICLIPRGISWIVEWF